MPRAGQACSSFHHACRVCGVRAHAVSSRLCSSRRFARRRVVAQALGAHASWSRHHTRASRVRAAHAHCSRVLRLAHRHPGPAALPSGLLHPRSCPSKTPPHHLVPMHHVPPRLRVSRSPTTAYSIDVTAGKVITLDKKAGQPIGLRFRMADVLGTTGYIELPLDPPCAGSRCQVRAVLWLVCPAQSSRPL